MTLRDQCPNEINNTEKWLHPSIPYAKHSLLLFNNKKKKKKKKKKKT